MTDKEILALSVLLRVVLENTENAYRSVKDNITGETMTVLNALEIVIDMRNKALKECEE